jgi:hypothetical protein
MRVVAISKSNMQQLSPKKVTTDQLVSYWGLNSQERLQRILESLLVSYGGAWFAWFISFMAGSFVSSILGSALIFNWMYSPWLNAKKRNSKIWPKTGEVINYAVFLGRIKSLKKVRRRAGKTIGAVVQQYLVMTIIDERDRELEIVTQWQDSYKRLRVDMQCDTVIASLDEDFSSIFMVTDLWAPATNAWIGDYPYLHREEFQRVIRKLKRSKKYISSSEKDSIQKEKNY